MATAGRSSAEEVRRKEKKNIVAGHAHIKSTFNNTVISITDPSGAVIMGIGGHLVVRGAAQIHAVCRADGS